MGEQQETIVTDMSTEPGKPAEASQPAEAAPAAAAHDNSGSMNGSGKAPSPAPAAGSEGYDPMEAMRIFDQNTRQSSIFQVCHAGLCFCRLCYELTCLFLHPHMQAHNRASATLEFRDLKYQIEMKNGETRQILRGCRFLFSYLRLVLKKNY